MADRTQTTLAQFYREFVQPDNERMLREVSAVRGDVAEYRHDNERHFDSIYKRIEDLKSEVLALVAAVKRIEAQLAAQTADRAELRQELALVKTRVGEIEEKIAQIESEL